MPQPQTYEEAVRELTEIVEKLEQKTEKLALEETIALYKRGRELERFCAERLRHATAQLEEVARAQGLEPEESAEQAGELPF